MSARRLAAALALAILALPATAAARPPSRVARAADTAVWSARRMAEARPLELVRTRGGTELHRVRTVPFESTEVVDPTVFPNSTNGRLFGHINGIGDYSCSATVLDTQNGRGIFTAGHCVFEPQLGRFAKDLTFVPAYSDGQSPYGVWKWTAVVTTRGWAFQGNPNLDYAAIKLARLNGVPIETAVGGGRALKTNVKRRQRYAAFGYPVNRGGGERMWTCTSGYAGKDPRPFPQGRAPSAIGCDMRAGASGGGWVNGAGRLVSVSSFGYSGVSNVVFGPYLTAPAHKIVARVGR